MKECKYCGSTYADSLSACPNCGGSKIVTAEEKIAEEKLYVKEVQNQERSVTVPAETEKKRIPGFIIALGVAVAVIAIIIAISAGGTGTIGGGNTLGNQTPQVDAAFEAGQKYYNNGNYEAAIGELSDVSADSEHYEDAQTMLADAVEKYRTATLDRVSTYTNNSEYETALSLLVEAQSVLPDDTALKTAYDNTYTAYVDSVIAKADSYSQAADYETAIGILNTAKNKYPQDTRLETSYVATYSAYKSLVCQTAISEADAYAANSDYVNAIQTLNAAVNKVGQDEAVTAKRKTYEDSYVSTVIAAAKAQYIEYNAESIFAAEEMINRALAILPGRQELVIELKFYEDHEPVAVIDLPSESSGGSWSSYFKSFGQVLGADGVLYDEAISLGQWHKGHPYEGDAGGYEYMILDYQYTRLTGKMFLSNDYKNTTATTTLKLFPGGSYEITSGVDTISFSVDITGLEVIEIWMEHSTQNTEANYAYLTELYVWK